MSVIVSKTRIWTEPNKSIKVEGEYKDRTMSSVKIRLKYTLYLDDSTGYDGYAMYVTPTIAGTQKSKITLKSTSISEWYGDPIEKYTSWYTISVARDVTSVSVKSLFSHQNDSNVTKTGTLSIPEYLAESKIGNIEEFNIDDTLTIPITKYVDTYIDNLDVTLNGTKITTRTAITDGYKLTFTEEEKTTIKSALNGLQGDFIFTLSSYDGSTLIGSSNTSAKGTTLDIVPLDSYYKSETGYKYAINGLVDTSLEDGLQVNGKLYLNGVNVGKEVFALSNYKTSAISNFTRGMCRKKNDRVVISFVGNITASKNTETVLFNLPDELIPSGVVRDINVIATSSSSVVVGYGYVRITGEVCVRFPTSAISTSYDIRLNGVYDID